MTREEKLQKAHRMFDNRNLLTELKWQREYFKSGYVNSQEELFSLWIFDECIKVLEQEPTTKNDLGVDCISRAEVLDLCDSKDPNYEILHLKEDVECLPSVYPMPSVTPQEPILDKIRAEIAEYGSIMVVYSITKNTKTDKGIEKLVSDVLKQAKKQVLAMIDMYKAESEG